MMLLLFTCGAVAFCLWVLIHAPKAKPKTEREKYIEAVLHDRPRKWTKKERRKFLERLQFAQQIPDLTHEPDNDAPQGATNNKPRGGGPTRR